MGRPKGSPNKVSSRARLRLEQLKCDPIERAVICANMMFDDGEIEKAGRLYADLIGYVAPKLKSMEISQDADNPVHFNITVGEKSAD